MAEKKYISPSTLKTFLDNLKKTFSSVSHKHSMADITDYVVDDELSSTSANPVANKTLDAEFEAVAAAMNALELSIDSKAESDHIHNDTYYTEAEIDEIVDEIDTSIEALQDLVGDTSVSEQIAQAVNGTATAVRYDVMQELSEVQKETARENIGSIEFHDVYKTYPYEDATTFYTWDGTKDGRDSFELGPYTYYKVSDDIPESSKFFFDTNFGVAAGTNHPFEESVFTSCYRKLNNSINCYSVSAAIVVTDLGIQTVEIDFSYFRDFEAAPDGYLGIHEMTFTAPSTGVYFPCDEYMYMAWLGPGLEDGTEDKTDVLLYDSKGTPYAAGVEIDSDGNKSLTIKDQDGYTSTLINYSTLNDKLRSKLTSPEAAKAGQILSIERISDNGELILDAIDNSNIETDESLSKEGFAADAAATGERLLTVESQIADLLYKPITISSFKNNSNITTILEKGATLADVVLTWETSKPAKSLTLSDSNGYSAGIDPTLHEVIAPNLPVTGNRTWTLTATDERDGTTSKPTNVVFYNGVYYGTIESGVNITSNIINDLVSSGKLTKKLQGTKTISKFFVNPSEDEHIMFTLPTSYGTPVFKDYDTGYGAGFYKLEEPITFTNSNDYEESYDIWLSTNTGLGEINIAVS